MQNPTENILGVSGAVAKLRHYIPKVAQRDSPVLITGETGTGKEGVAVAIHQLSERRQAPFVAVNCAALPESLIESELFGHERGAFTGAVRTQHGKAAEADGGTLFLDEIGEMPYYGQAKLLRFLETNTVDRIGLSRPVKVDVRVIAATNQTLESLMEAHQFRADLYYRLNVARIELDPLRDRIEDIPVLTARFIDHFNDLYRLDVDPPGSALLNALESYDWPGNIRELRNMVEAMFIDPPTGTPQLGHLPQCFRRLLQEHRRTVMNERDELIATLRDTNWNKSEAAKALNYSRMTLYRKIAKYDLHRSTTHTSN